MANLEKLPRCPFCSNRLTEHYYEYEDGYGDKAYNRSGLWVCDTDEHCPHYNCPYDQKVWREFLKGKMAIDTLKMISKQKYYEETEDGKIHYMAPMCTQIKLGCIIDTAKKALEEIYDFKM